MNKDRVLFDMVNKFIYCIYNNYNFLLCDYRVNLNVLKVFTNVVNFILQITFLLSLHYSNYKLRSIYVYVDTKSPIMSFE